LAELLDLAARIAAAAREGEQIEAYVEHAVETSVRAYEGEVETVSSAESAGIGVRVVTRRRQGFAHVGALDDTAASWALAEARDNAAFATVDEHAGLALPDGVTAADLDLWHDDLTAFPTDSKIALALELDGATRGGDPRIRKVTESEYNDVRRESAIATSAGISGARRSTRCSLATFAIAGEGDDTQTGFGFTAARGPSGLDVDVAASDAVRRAVRMLGSTKPRSASLPVVLDRRVAANVLSILAGTLSGEEVAKGRSLFAGRQGEAVAAQGVTLVDDPTNPAAFGASPYDGEGLACRRNLLIEGGKLLGFLYSSYAGRFAGVPSTASAVRGGHASTPGTGARAVAIEPGELEQEAILAAVGRGLFVQSVTGIHSGVNRISGDFSVGAEGLLIEGGELTQPVREITVASTIQRMLQNVMMIGSDLEWLPGVSCGVTVAMDDLAMSGA
jgi:PmbA protein